MESEFASFFYDSSSTDKCEETIDYFISWTLRCAKTKDENTQKTKVHIYAKRILSKLLFDDVDCLDNSKIERIETWKQSRKIDIWVEVEIENDPQKYALIIENKLYAYLEEHQLPTYKANALDYYDSNKDYEIKFIFLRCDDFFQKNDEYRCKQHGFTPYLLCDIKKEAVAEELTGNYLFDEFWFYWWDKINSKI